MDGLKILIIDDEKPWLNILEKHVKQTLPSCKISKASTVSKALKSIREFDPDILITDLNLEPNEKHFEGWELIYNRETPCIIVSAWAHVATLNKYLGNVVGIFPKISFDEDAFKEALKMTAKDKFEINFSAQELWKIIVGPNALTFNELKIVYFLLNLDFDEFPGGVSEKALALVQHLDRRDKLDKLMEILEDRFPHTLSNID